MNRFVEKNLLFAFSMLYIRIISNLSLFAKTFQASST
jgi:hypothetical protein